MERSLSLCVKSFLPACREKKERLFTYHRSACKVWVDSDKRKNSTLNVTYATVARCHSIIIVVQWNLKLPKRTKLSRNTNASQE